MKTGPINSYSLKWAVALHGLLLAAAAIVPLVPGCRTKEIAIPLDFTIVLDANQIDPNVPEETAEPAPKPAPLPEPSKPTPLPDPPKDAVIVEKKKEPEKKVEKKPDPPKPPPKKPEPPPKKPEFQKGKRVEAQKKPQPPRFDEIYKPYDPSKPTSAKPVTDKQLSRDEIEKALRDGARAGTRNSIPEDEVSRCVLLVRRALHDAWVQPSAGDAGPQPAFLDIRLDSTGRIVSYRISQSSGSAYFDQTVLKAAANAQPIRGLTLAFLKQYETVTVEFRLE